MTERNPVDYAVIDVQSENDTCPFNGWLVVNEDQEILANCASREIADLLAAALRARGEHAPQEEK